MTERENFFRIINGQQPAWTPCFYDAYAPCGSSLLNNQGETGVGGRDMYGVNWLVSADTGYEAIPDPREHILDEVTDWRDIIRFPDLDAMDWAAAARKDMAHVDRENKVVCYYSMEGNFNRLQSFMGVCEALMAMLEDTEEVCELFEALTEFKIKSIEKVAQYYKPDIFVNGDDVCASSGLFFSPALHDELVKPYEKRIAQAAIDHGMLVEHHVCGKVTDIIDHIVDTGARIWQTAQPMNDLNGIKAKYGDKLLIHGGWDSTGPHNMDDATEEMVRAEVRRCIDAYGTDGNYMLFPIIIGDPAVGIMQRKRAWASDECRKYSEKLFAKN